MAQITDYASLKANIADWLNRSDLTGVIPNFIQMAEARIRRVMRSKHKLTQNVSVVADDGDYTLSASIENYAVYITSPEGYEGKIDPVPPAQLYDNRRLNKGNSGRPLLYSIIDDTLLLSPLPDQAYTLRVVYEGLTPLSDSNTTNTILTNYPDVYVYGALIHAAPYLQDDERLMMWKSFFDEGLRELEVAQQRAEFAQPIMKAPVNLSPVHEQIYGR